MLAIHANRYKTWLTAIRKEKGGNIFSPLDNGRSWSLKGEYFRGERTVGNQSRNRTPGKRRAFGGKVGSPAQVAHTGDTGESGERKCQTPHCGSRCRAKELGLYLIVSGVH